MNDTTTAPPELPPYLRLKLEHAQHDIAARVAVTHLERILAYELFVLSQLIDEAIREGSPDRAKEALEYAQGLRFATGQYASCAR